MGTAAPIKSQVTKAVRDAALMCFEADGLRARRATGANAFIELDEVFLCFNVQYSQSSTATKLRFCVNYGVLPKEMFEENWTGYLGKYPREIDCVYRSRLKPKLGPGDWWWNIADPEKVPCLLEKIQQAARLVQTDLVPKLQTALGCLTHQNIANTKRASLRLDQLKEWRDRYA